MSQLHKEAKIIFVEEIACQLPAFFIDDKIEKYERLEKNCKEPHNKSVARILAKRYTDMKVTLEKSLTKTHL